MSLSGHPQNEIARHARTIVPARMARHLSSHGRSKRWLEVGPVIDSFRSEQNGSRFHRRYAGPG